MAWSRKRITVIGASALVIVALGGIAISNKEFREWTGLEREPGAGLPLQPREKAEMIAGDNSAEAGAEAFEAATIADQFAEARLAPGIVAPGAYGAAYSQLTAVPATKGAWHDVTQVPYDADDPRYRDFASNSSGGAGLVTGRITGLAVDGDYVYAAGADGGVWRSSTGGGHWTPIADKLPSLSSGWLVLAGDGSLWYATGEANTGGTSYVGSGVYRLGNPRTGQFSPADRVGGSELESTTIHKLRFIDGRVWAPTLRGLYSHEMGTTTGAWRLEFAPNPSYLPGGPDAGTANAAYKNIVNDVAGDPRNPRHIVAASAWRSGDTYNGFYEASDYTTHGWVKVNPTGAMPADDIGYVTFAFAADGSKLYAINQSPKLLNKPTGTVNSYLDGVYVSNTGSPAGPWNKIADSPKLANSGSALKQSVGGKGYGPGIQAWYNQFLAVDPANPQHLWLGLEEVYETTDGGSSWKTIGPYWNFYFPCWNISDSANTCPDSTHPDQHSVAVGNGYVYVGNDGGVYRRPVNGTTNRDNHATDWQSLNDGIHRRAAVLLGLGRHGPGRSRRRGERWSAGQRRLHPSTRRHRHGLPLRRRRRRLPSRSGQRMPTGSGVRQPVHAQDRELQRQPRVPRRVHLDLAQHPALHQHPRRRTGQIHRSVQPRRQQPEHLGRRRTARLGQHCGVCDPERQGLAQCLRSRCRSYRHVRRRLPRRRLRRLVRTLQQRRLHPRPRRRKRRRDGLAPTDPARRRHGPTQPLHPGSRRRLGQRHHAFVAINGYSRRFTEGPGAGIGHVYETNDRGATWSDVSTNLPDIPASSIKVLPNGGLILATDLTAFYRAPKSSDWKRLGTGLPLTVGMDIEYVASNNTVYLATHGRGIWSFAMSQL